MPFNILNITLGYVFCEKMLECESVTAGAFFIVINAPF